MNRQDEAPQMVAGNVVFDAPPEMLSNYVAPTIPVINVDMDKLARRCCDRGEDHWWGINGEGGWIEFNFCPDCGAALREESK